MGISSRFLFLCLLRCVTSAGLASYTYVFSVRWWVITPTGFPHSEFSGSLLFSSSPKLIAGYTSFFAYWCQGIHQQPLVTWSQDFRYYYELFLIKISLNFFASLSLCFRHVSMWSILFKRQFLSVKLKLLISYQLTLTYIYCIPKLIP